MKALKNTAAYIQNKPIQAAIFAVLLIIAIVFIAKYIRKGLSSASYRVKVRNIDPENVSGDFVDGVPALVSEVYRVYGETLLDDFWGQMFSAGDSEKTNLTDRLLGLQDSELAILYTEWNKIYEKQEEESMTEYIDSQYFTGNSERIAQLVGRLKSLGLN